MNSSSATTIVELLFHHEPNSNKIEVRVNPTTPLSCYKRIFQNELHCDMYGRMLVFQYGGKIIRYAKDIEQLPPSTTKSVVIDVYYEEFPDE